MSEGSCPGDTGETAALVLAIQSSWLTVKGGRRSGAAGVLHRRGGRAVAAGLAGVARRVPNSVAPVRLVETSALGGAVRCCIGIGLIGEPSAARDRSRPHCCSCRASGSLGAAGDFSAPGVQQRQRAAVQHRRSGATPGGCRRRLSRGCRQLARLLYTKLAIPGGGPHSDPNSVVLAAAPGPLREPHPPNVKVRLAAGSVEPGPRDPRQRITTPTRAKATVPLEEIDGEDVVVRVQATTPERASDGAHLADETIEALTNVTGGHALGVGSPIPES